MINEVILILGGFVIVSMFITMKTKSNTIRGLTNFLFYLLLLISVAEIIFDKITFPGGAFCIGAILIYSSGKYQRISNGIFLNYKLGLRQEEFTTGKGFEPETADRLLKEIRKLEEQIKENECKN